MKYEKKHCSRGINRLIAKKDFNSTVMLDRKARAVIPFHELAIGWSFWIDLDETEREEWQHALGSMRYYNNARNVEFVAHKHRGDLRKSGYKYLEIGRIK